MNKQNRFLIIVSCFITFLILSVGTTLAATSADTIVATGVVINDDLNVTDDLDLEEDSIVNGSVNIFAGDAEIAGTINGDLFVVGGDVQLHPTAAIAGECVIVGGTLLENTSNMSCTTVGEFELPIGNLAAGEFAGMGLADGDGADFGRMSLGNTFWGTIGSSILLGLLAMATTAVAPSHVKRVSEAIQVKPVATGTVGVLTFVASVSIITIVSVISTVLAVVCVGLLGVPVVLAMGAMLVTAFVVGWVSVGTIIGEVLRDALHLHQISLPMTAALGTAALSLALGMVGLMPAIGIGADIAAFLIGGIGLGATALTRFGTRPWPLFAIDPGKEEIVINSLDDEIKFL